MNRSTVWLLVVVLVTVSSAAMAVDLTVGFTGGASLPWFSGDGYDLAQEINNTETALKLGYGAGIFARIGLMGFLAVQPEVVYSMLGGAYGDSSVTEYDNYSYIEVPVLVMPRLKLGNVTFTPLAGPLLLFPFGKWTAVGRDSDTGEKLGTNDISKGNTHSPIFGLAAGAGVIIPLGGLSLSIDGRCLVGLSDILSTLKLRQNAVLLRVGVGFDPLH